MIGVVTAAFAAWHYRAGVRSAQADVDFAEVMQRVHGVIQAIEPHDSVERYTGLGVDVVQGWMESIGPTTVPQLADRLHLPVEGVMTAMLKLESQGQVLRGQFRAHAGLGAPDSSLSGISSSEWCHRRLLARIHRLTIGRLRKEIEPVSAAEFMRFLFQWHHVAPGSRQHGEAGLTQVIAQLAGFEAAASAWEPQLLRLRLAKYEPELLDRLCLSGAVSWGRLSPHPRLAASGESDKARRIVPTSVAPVSLFPREDGDWLMAAFAEDAARDGDFVEAYFDARGAKMYSLGTSRS